MERQFISTREELAGYLQALAWKRYRVDFDSTMEPVVTGEGPLTQAEVRAAVAAMESKIRWRLYGNSYEN